MRALEQTQRSALRRSLQQVFKEGTLGIANHIFSKDDPKVVFYRSWKTMLCLIGLRSKINIDTLSASEIMSLLKEKRIISVSRKHTHTHHSLTRGSVKCISAKALLSGAHNILSIKLETALKSERVAFIENPWQYVLPEDIGSCYEVIMECQLEKSNEIYSLVPRGDRRASGIIHTPHDLASHMCDVSLNNSGLIQKDYGNIIAIDLAHGAGAFTLQMARKISKAAKLDIKEVFSKCIIGFDIDSSVLDVASFCFHIESNFPANAIRHNLVKLDTLDGDKSVRIIQNHISKTKQMRKRLCLIALGNPPYVEVKLEPNNYPNFETRKSRNLSAYFLEQAIKILPLGSIVSQVVPISLIHSERMESFRSFLINRSKSIRIESYDCVPGYMFDQGKIGSNSNTSITQRIAIIQLTTGEDLRRFVTSRYMRWRGDERNHLFDAIPSIRLNKQQYTKGLWPSIGTKKEKQVLTQVFSNKRNLSDLISKDGKVTLFIPNSTRYFISAVHENLGRGQQTLKLIDEQSRDLVQVIINSEFFYWYWRVTDGGFSVSLNTIKNLRLPSSENVNFHERDIRKIAKKLRSKKIMNHCRVVKSNKGNKINYKFDKDQSLMKEIDELIHVLYELKEKCIFHAHKSNSLEGLSRREFTDSREN